LHQDFGAGVHRAGGLVEDEDRGIGQKSPSDGDELLLAGAHIAALIVDHGDNLARHRQSHRARLDLHASHVRDGLGTRGVRADPVALDEGAAARLQEDPRAGGISRDDVAVVRAAAADDGSVAVLAGDAELTMRTLGVSTRILVASPQLANRLHDLTQLSSLPTLATTNDDDVVEWYLETDDGRSQVIQHEPRMACGDFAVVRDAAIAGHGIALLPDHFCRQALDDGQLVHVLSDWRGHRGIVHLVFTTRRGLPPAVRALIDHLAAGFSRNMSSDAGYS